MTRYRRAVDGASLAAWVCGLTIAACATTTAGQDVPSVATGQTSAEKSERTKAQTKLDTRLRAAIERLHAKETRVDAPPRAGALDLDESGRVLVDIQARVSAELRHAIEAAGGLVVSEFSAYDSIRARLPLAQIEILAEREDVKFVRTAERGVTNPSESVR